MLLQLRVAWRNGGWPAAPLRVEMHLPAAGRSHVQQAGEDRSSKNVLANGAGAGLLAVC